MKKKSIQNIKDYNMNLCQYRDIAGKPGEGFHRHFLGIAVGDVLGTVLIVFLIHKIFSTNFWLLLAITMLIAVLVHRLFCVDTTVNKILFGKYQD